MRGNKHSGSSAVPWGSKDSGAFSSLHQFRVEFVYLGSCLSRLGLGKGNEALLFFAMAMALQAATMNFLSSTNLAFAFFCGLLLGLELGFGLGGLDKGQGERGSRVPVELQAGQIVLKNTPTTVSTEASDRSGSRPTRGGEVATCSCCPGERKIKKGSCGHGEGGLEMDVSLGAM
jgi:hypothetical protein